MTTADARRRDCRPRRAGGSASVAPGTVRCAAGDGRLVGRAPWRSVPWRSRGMITGTRPSAPTTLVGRDHSPVRHQRPRRSATSSRSSRAASRSTCAAPPCRPPPHIGHIRSGLNFDIMRRWFAYRGYDVTFIRNVTDIDDKIIAEVGRAGPPLVGDRLRERAGLRRRLHGAGLPAADHTNRGPPATSPRWSR